MSVGFGPVSSTPTSALPAFVVGVSGQGDLEFVIAAYQTNFIYQILTEQRQRRIVIAVELSVNSVSS